MPSNDEYSAAERRAADTLIANLQQQLNTHAQERREDNKAATDRYDKLFEKAGEAVTFALQNGDAVQRSADEVRELKKTVARLDDRIDDLERTRVSDHASRKVSLAMIAGAGTVMATLATLVVGVTDMLWNFMKGK